MTKIPVEDQTWLHRGQRAKERREFFVRVTEGRQEADDDLAKLLELRTLEQAFEKLFIAGSAQASAMYEPVHFRHLVAHEGHLVWHSPGDAFGREVVHRLARLEAEVRSLRLELKEQQLLRLPESRNLQLPAPITTPMETASVTRDASVLGQLASVCDVKEIEKVVEHFRGRPRLLEVIVNAAVEANRRFDSSKPGLKPDGQQLVFAIPTALDVDEAEARFTAFVREWWIRNVSIEDQILATLNYV